MAGVEIKKVDLDENAMRLDRWFKVHYPGLGFGHLQKLLRSGQIRVDGGRVKADTRLETGQSVRVPPLPVDEKSNTPLTGKTIRGQDDGDVLKQMLIYEDPKVFVFNKPAGLAVQGGSGVNRHVDGMLEAWRNKKGEKPRLVHRLDRDTSGVLVVARTRGAAQALTKAFRARETKKTYWALVRGVPKKREDKISTWVVRETTPDGDRMRVCEHGEPDSDHAVTYYRMIEARGQLLSWLEMEPFTGRTHQLRVHAAFIDHPIIGDPKYFFSDSNWDMPGGMQNRLHLHARRIRIPNPSGGILDVSAPLPPHMVQSFNLLAVDAIQRCIDATFDDFHYERPSLQATRAIIGLSLNKAIATLLHKDIDTAIEEMVLAYQGHYRALRQSGALDEPLYDGIAELIQTLSHDQHIILGMVTGKSHRGVKFVCEAHHIDCFVTIRTADDCPSKPNPAMVLECCRETGIAPQNTYVIGDAVYDIQMAKSAGATAIGVSWGYGVVDALKAAHSDYILEKPSDLLTILEMKKHA